MIDVKCLLHLNRNTDHNFTIIFIMYIIFKIWIAVLYVVRVFEELNVKNVVTTHIQNLNSQSHVTKCKVDVLIHLLIRNYYKKEDLPWLIHDRRLIYYHKMPDSSSCFLSLTLRAVQQLDRLVYRVNGLLLGVGRQYMIGRFHQIIYTHFSGHVNLVTFTHGGGILHDNN